MRIKKTILTLLILFSTLCITKLSVKAENYSLNNDYVIDSYDVDIIVNENNTFDITETINAYFNEPKHGIYRTIPLKNEVVRLDGSRTVNRVKITNLNVNESYITKVENGNYKVQIGSASSTVTGNKEYIISYNYNIGKDPCNDYDEFYFNIIGNSWDTEIGNITFKITMPKEFDDNKLGFSSGEYGLTENSDVHYEVNGNVITGYYNGILDSGEALTIRAILDEGYFVNAGLPISKSVILMSIIPLAGLIISLILWFIYGRDNKPVVTVEFYPPEGFNSLEIGYLYKGKADNKDVISLLIYLANKGYIKICETSEKSLLSKVISFKIVKLKDYDGDNANERLFLNGLFKDNNVIGEGTDNLSEVTSLELENKFYKTVNSILKNMNNKENKYKIFEKTTIIKYVLVVLSIIISIITVIGLPTLEYGNIGAVLMTLFLALFYTPFYAVMFIKKIPLLFRLFWGSFTIIHSLVFFSTTPLAEALKNDNYILLAFIFGILCIIGMIMCLKYMPKRNKYGNEILGKIMGFKNFLESCEKEKLESLVMKNPTYFHDILPYTYVLGISDKWISKFEYIAIEPPSWYDGNTSFNMVSFGVFMNSTMASASKTMTSSPSSSSGGSSSGGGFSGGGSGGGGGGSW